MRIRVKLAFGKVLYGWWFEVSVTYSVRYNLIKKVENIYYMTVFHIADDLIYGFDIILCN